MDCDYPGPRHAVSDLRYSGAEVSRAAREGRRDRPSARTTRVPGRSWAFGVRPESTGDCARLIEGGARTRSRADLGVTRQVVSAALRAGDPDARFAADDVDPAPIRHRHSALWEVW